jgi:hypothetical protein
MILTPFTLALLGSSLTTGRLSGDWAPRLAHDLPEQPEAKGPINLYNLGKGSQNSAWGVTQAPVVAGYNPTHVLMEGFAINDSIDFGGGPAISRADHITNMQTIVATLRARNAAVDITIQTMNPVSAAGAAIRPNLPDYYADELATAALLNTRSLDHYSAWPHPLPNFLSNGAAINAGAWTGTWNPADQSGMGLSNGNLTALSTGGATGVRGAISKAAGKFYFDATINSAMAANSAIGIMPASAALTIQLGTAGLGSGVGAGYAADGAVWINGVLVTHLLPYGAGNLVQVYADLTAGRIWFGVDGTWLGGDPVAGVGGFAITTGTNYFAGFTAGNGGNQVTANFANVYPGDGLHPLFSGGVDTYHYPSVLTWARARMAELWP